jgi:pre-mRNA-splicing factor ATP-dependent RNA helicase DHX16
VEESKEETAERERAERESEAKTEHERLQADRRKLPMFPYRWVGDWGGGG